MTKTIVYIDLDGVIAGCSEKARYENKEHKEDVMFFLTLSICPAAKESIEKLASIPDVDFYFLSKPSWSNPYSYAHKRIWLEKHFGDIAYKRLILTHNKSLLKGDFLLDDYNKNRDGFGGEFVLIGSYEYPTIKEGIDYVLSRIGYKENYKKEGGINTPRTLRKATTNLGVNSKVKEITDYMQNIMNLEYPIKNKVAIVDILTDKFPTATENEIHLAIINYK